MPENVQISLGVKADTKQSQQDITALSRALKDLQNVADGIGKGNSIADYGRQIKQAASDIAHINGRANIAKAFEAFNETPSMANLTKFSNAVQSEYNRTAKEVAAAAKETSSSRRRMADSVKSSESPLRNFAKLLMRIAKLRLLRGIIRAITQAFKEGTENIYQYSAALNSADASHFKTTMDGLASSFLYLKNYIGSVVAPLLSALLPAIQTVISWITVALDLLAQFFAVLNGQSTYTVARKTATEWKDVGSAVGGAAAAAKEYENTVLGFDELNILNDVPESGAGGGGGAGTPDYSDMFEERDLPKNLITDFANFVKPVVKSVWDFIEDSVNGFIDAFPAVMQFAKGVFTGNIDDCIEAFKKFQKILMDNKTAKFLFDMGANIAEFLKTAIDNVSIWFLETVQKAIEGVRPFLEFLGVDVDKLTGKIETQKKKIEDHKFATHQDIEKWRLWAEGIDKATATAMMDIEKWQYESGKSFANTRGAANGAADAVKGVITASHNLSTTNVGDLVERGLWGIYNSANYAKWELYGVLDYVRELARASLNGIYIAVGLNSGGGSGRYFANGGYVTGYANGGIIPRFDGGGINSADLFMANENANPELVGRIGSRTAVANQGQMVEALAEGLSRAFANMSEGGTSNIEVVVNMDGVAVARANDRGQRQLNRRFNVQLA